VEQNVSISARLVSPTERETLVPTPVRLLRDTANGVPIGITEQHIS
jgi:hypothetical protein